MSNKLWCDCKSVKEKIAFLESGRAYDTGVISKSVVSDIIQILKQNQFLIGVLERALKDMDNVDEVCKLAGVHKFDLMRKDLQEALKKAGYEECESDNE